VLAEVIRVASVSMALVGSLLEREDELGILGGVVDGVAGGRGCLVLVGGEAGIGKTSLVRALRERAGERLTFLVGACEPLSVPVPLGPLRELFEAAGGGDLAALGSDDRLVLARCLLNALAQRAPVVAAIEDVHWADPLTLDLVRILARRVEEMSVAIVVTYRDDEVAANPALGLLLGDLATSPAVRRIALRPLSEPAVRELAGPAGLDGGELARATGGNPFLVVEAIAAGGRLPASVRDAALARAGRLSAAARRVVDAAAVIGQRFGPEMLQSLVPASADAVEEALARGVLVADGRVLGFRHELIRQAIEGSISPLRRSELHARVVSALAEQAGAADSAQLAHHAELGGLTAEACRYARLAATDAERVGALREMRLQAERALRLGAGLAPDERFELLIQYSRASNFASTRLADAASAAERAVALADELRDPLKQGRALVVLAWALWSLDRVGEAVAAAERAIAVLEPTGDVAALARAHSTQIRMEATAGDPAAAIELGPTALGRAASAGLDEVRIDIAISVALAHGHRGERDALEMLSAALATARAAGLTIQTVRTYVNLVFLGTILREHGFVDATARAALALFDEYQTTIPGYAVEIFRARSLLDRGRWDEARATATRTDRDWVGETPVALAIEGIVGIRRGESGAAAVLERAWEGIRHVPESSRHGAIRVALVESAWLEGDHVTAAERIRAARQSIATARFARTAGELALWASRYGVQFEAPPRAPLPVLLELDGDWRGAIRAWHELEAPYEAALAALPGDQRAAGDALATLHQLGATAAAKAFARERTARGARPSRGPRRSTLANAAGLTRREQEVLAQLATGATNGAIAAALQLSERTVAHHVSAILGKLGAANRLVAVEQARVRGLLAQDGPVSDPR
jgi:DNA-binding CsgD family transcriptional regulator/tetratricopeptide (TPR) repeat protein